MPLSDNDSDLEKLFNEIENLFEREARKSTWESDNFSFFHTAYLDSGAYWRATTLRRESYWVRGMGMAVTLVTAMSTSLEAVGKFN